MAVHDHGDHTHRPRSTRFLVWAAGANVAFAVVQVVVGVILGSVVVLADAAHQVVDALGLVTAAVALSLIRRGSTDRMSYGWGKADALGALLSGVLLAGSLAWILYEAVDRLRDPVAVPGGGVIAVGVAGVLVNGGSLALVGDAHQQLSLRAVRLHLFTDLAGSLIVVATGISVVVGFWEGIDPVASLVVSAMVLHATWRLLSNAVHELLDRTPETVTPDSVRAALADLHGVQDVHHVHARSLGGGQVSVTAHVVVDGEQSLHEAQARLGEVATALAERLGVAHTTLQLECHDCEAPEH